MISYKHNSKVFYRDIDSMGIVYYSRYFEYFEEARTELLNSIALNINLIEENGIFLPVISTHCDFKKGLKLEQNFTIKTMILGIPRAKLKINYKIYIQNKVEYLVRGYTEHAFMKMNGKPTKPPDFIIEAIKNNWSLEK